MGTTIFDLADKMQDVINGLDSEIEKILNSVEDDIVLQQQKRLEQGLFVSGKEIYPFYTPYTIREKKEKGQVYDEVTLFDTGKFYEGIFAAQFEDELIIDSHDEKTTELKEKYSENIFGVTEDNTVELYGITTPMLTDFTKRITGL